MELSSREIRYAEASLCDQRLQRGLRMQSFHEMSLANELQKALSDLKFINPTDIQKAVLPIAMQGCDLMACAQTGSGKTAAYGIPMVTRLLDDPQKHALVLAPTRELAHQISDFLRELTQHCKNIQVTSLVGGADMRKQFQALKRKPRIIVATPGRLTDHLKRKSLHLKSTEILVLDEGDRMLDMGFAPQLDEILKYLPKQRQTTLFTATLPKKVQMLAAQYLFEPQIIHVGEISQPVATVKQSVVQLRVKEKDNRIVDELNQRQGSVIVFTKTKRRTDSLARSLSLSGFSVELIHGGRTQGQRNKAIQNFKSGRRRILCATDVAARGIDIPQVEHVINFDLPMMDEDYVHRIGRTARNGASGEAVSFVTPEEHRAWQTLARKYKIKDVELEGVTPERKPQNRRRPSRKRFADEQSTREFKDNSPAKKKKKFSAQSLDASSTGHFAKKRTKKSNDQQDSESNDRPYKKKSFSKTGSFFNKKRNKKSSSQSSRY